MIISRTPLRISFVGGGSDIPQYYKSNPGAVVSTTINKYIYITVNKKFDHQIRASYSKTEIVDRIENLKHAYIRECLKFVGIKGGVEITSISDIPSEGTGLGSSSSYLVGLLNALYAYSGKHVSADRLAYEACEIELNILKKNIGKQDQYIAAFGGLQNFVFKSDGTVENTPIICLPKTKKVLQKRLLLLYTGLTRSANKILTKQANNIIKNSEKMIILDNMANLAHSLTDTLHRNNLSPFGKFLHENWMLKKQLADEISNPSIEKWYTKALKAGAEGGKILGAGGGGFILLYAKPQHHTAIKSALQDLKVFEFAFEPQGSKIIFVGN